MTSIPSRRERKKDRTWTTPILVLASIVLVATLIFIGFAFLRTPIHLQTTPTEKTSEAPPEDDLIVLQDKTMIMLMGVDQRTDDVGRSDTLMVICVDPKTDTATLLSIPRDARVPVGRYGYDKINAAYAYGDERLSQRTVEDFLGINIDHYVIVNVNSFVNIIDAIGGVDINVEKRMYYEDVWDDDGGLLIDLQPGMQHMDGKTAVTYVRYRDEEGDIGRVRRQQKFMQACLDQATSPSIIAKLPAVLTEVLTSIRTDLSFSQILEIAGTLRNAEKKGLRTETIPGEYRYINGISYFLPDMYKLDDLIDSAFIHPSRYDDSLNKKKSRTSSSTDYRYDSKRDSEPDTAQLYAPDPPPSGESETEPASRVQNSKR